MLRSTRDDDNDSLKSVESEKKRNRESTSLLAPIIDYDDEEEDKVSKLKSQAMKFARTVNKDHLKTFGFIAIICFLLLRLSATSPPPPQGRVTKKSAKGLRNHIDKNTGGKRKKKRYYGEEGEEVYEDNDDQPRKKNPSSVSFPPILYQLPPNSDPGGIQLYRQQEQPPPPPMLYSQQGGLMQQQQFMPQQGNMMTMHQGGMLRQPPQLFHQQDGIVMQQENHDQSTPQNGILQQQEQQIQQQLALLKQQQELLLALQQQNPVLALQQQAGAVSSDFPDTVLAATLPSTTMTTPVDPNRPTNSDMAKLEKEITLSELGNFAETWDPYDAKLNPIFWHIPKAGGSSVKDVIGSCHRHVMATEFGVTDGHGADTEIAIVYPKAPGAVAGDRSPFVNVDTTTVAGIARAKQMGFADSGLAQCVVTPFLWEANELFTPTAKGRLFAVFRHPVERAVSMFYYIQVADWEPSYAPELKSWTLEQYARSEKIENNWMTRQLANQPGGELTDYHLKIAMEVIRRKFLVGTMKKLEESMTRFEQFFQWKYHVNPPNQEACRKRLTGGGSNSNAANKKEKPKPGDPVWEAIADSNLFDIQVYEYIESLFEEQAAFVQGMPANFREIDATCCKCDPPTYPPEGFTCPKVIPN